jgi:hypothetical protein
VHLTRAVLVAALVVLGVPAGAHAAPRCFGAADRDNVAPCHNRALERLVLPTPHRALFVKNAPCAFVRLEVPFVCSFGAPLARATRTIALMGDSHATHWRPALAPIATLRGWHALNLTRAGCPFSTGTPILRPALFGSCLLWRSRIPAWFRLHPEVDTVFVSEHHGRVAGGLPAAIRGYERAWRLLPRTVRRIVVIRDTPVRHLRYRACVVHAIGRHQRAGRVCAMPRSTSLPVDPAAIAARRTRSKRVQLVDLTRFFCSAAFCYPVIGGVLVQKDVAHITRAFMRTMAPYLARALAARGV